MIAGQGQEGSQSPSGARGRGWGEGIALGNS